jgi:hypothetical protein
VASSGVKSILHAVWQIAKPGIDAAQKGKNDGSVLFFRWRLRELIRLNLL